MGNKRSLYHFGPFELDRTAGVVFCDGEPVMLAPRTVATLIALVDGGGRVLNKEELMHAIWGDRVIDEVNLTQQISLLRRALSAKDPSTDYIRNFPGRGYQFSASVRTSETDEAETGPLQPQPLKGEAPPLPSAARHPRQRGASPAGAG